MRQKSRRRRRTAANRTQKLRVAVAMEFAATLLGGRQVHRVATGAAVVAPLARGKSWKGDYKCMPPQSRSRGLTEEEASGKTPCVCRS